MLIAGLQAPGDHGIGPGMDNVKVSGSGSTNSKVGYYGDWPLGLACMYIAHLPYQPPTGRGHNRRSPWIYHLVAKLLILSCQQKSM